MFSGFNDKTALVVGATDMVGLHLLTRLKRYCQSVIGISDLHTDTVSLQYLEREIQRSRIDMIFFIPNERYGIAAHLERPGEVYYESVVFFAHLLEAARKAGVKKVVNILSNCIYPAAAKVPYREDCVWDGLPEETLIPHGMARRMSLVHADAYRRQYGLQTVSAVLASVFGPYDNFDPARAQVMPAMIRRFCDARLEGREQVVCWGTGRATREFIYVNDAVRALMLTALYYDSSEPLNIGSQQETPLKDLVAAIVASSGYAGEIRWDADKPEGRLRVCLDSSRMRKLLPSWKMTPLEQAVEETVRWYMRT